LATYETDETGTYLFKELMPGSYELEFILAEGDILSPAFKGNNDVALIPTLIPRQKLLL
jgi:hypothetical protein